jgi:hypothetical protein
MKCKTTQLNRTIYKMPMPSYKKYWVCGLHSLSRAPELKNEKPTPLFFGEREERYSKGRIPGLKLSLTSVPSEFCPRSYTTSFPSFQL